MGGMIVIDANGEKMKRPRGSSLPCWKCPKVPLNKRHPEKSFKEPSPDAVELSPKNKRAIWYWRQCKVDKAGLLPVDRVTLTNHALIEMVQESHDRAIAEETNESLSSLWRLTGK